MSFSNKSVIGLGFGDEGKGLVTDYLCSQQPASVVVRFCGGHQAGHTVVRNGVRHVFSSFGSGTLVGAPTIWSRNCTVEPIGLMNEYFSLQTKKNCDPVIYVHPEAPITTPIDMVANQMSSSNNAHGTCGVGFGTTLKRVENGLRISFSDIYHPTILKMKYDLVEDYYRGAEADLSSQWVANPKAWSIDSKDRDCFFNACANIRRTKNVMVWESQANYAQTIFEGSQGLLLDKDIGFFPHVTRGNTGTAALSKECLDQYFVTRAYQTRHGNGPMTNEALPHNIEVNPQETNTAHRYQGEFRRTLLDIDLLKYAIAKDATPDPKACRTLVITCLDHVRNELRYTRNGEIVYCDTEREFVVGIATALGFTSILISRGPTAKDISWGYPLVGKV